AALRSAPPRLAPPAPVRQPAQSVSRVCVSRPVSMRDAEGDVALAPATAARDQAVPLKTRAARRAIVLTWVPALLALCLLDVTFSQWFWRIPKLTPASADYGYQFLVDARALAATPKQPGTPRVLAVGSSVAG